MICKPEIKRWLVVVAFAAAMAWMESAVVLYLRTLTNRIQPHQPSPLPIADGLAGAELVREAATLIMLAMVGWLAGRTWRSRLGYFLIAFGIWDIGYYVFLVPLTGWPDSLLDWDILFLIPLPWWGPVLAPVLIALLMVLGGTLLAFFDEQARPLWPPRWAVAVHLAGITLALYVFMADAIRAVIAGSPAVSEVLPQKFRWLLFLPALALMAAPIIELARLARQRAARSNRHTGDPPTATGGDPDRAFHIAPTSPNG